MDYMTFKFLNLNLKFLKKDNSREESGKKKKGNAEKLLLVFYICCLLFIVNFLNLRDDIKWTLRLFVGYVLIVHIAL